MANFKKLYLLGYNATELAGWAFVLLLTIWKLVVTMGTSSGVELYGFVGMFLYFFQMLMVLDVVHSAAGLISSPVATAAMQVASRVLVVSVLHGFPSSRTTKLGLLLILFAWSPTEVIRYLYYILNSFDKTGKYIPKFLLWIRYSAFIALYPAGISGEIIILITSFNEIRADSVWHPFAWFLVGVFCVYPIGSVILFKHMLKQRSKTLSPHQKKTQ